MKWIVIWVLSYSSFIPCPEIIDDITNEAFATTSTKCYNLVQKELSKVFSDSLEMAHFIKRLKSDSRVMSANVYRLQAISSFNRSGLNLRLSTLSTFPTLSAGPIPDSVSDFELSRVMKPEYKMIKGDTIIKK